MPIFAWSMLVFAGMIVFPAVILATLLLEIERAFGWPFFTAARGGDPLLWQHLFWFFGHPEVYIIFLPAAGLVSMIAPTMAQRPLLAYRLTDEVYRAIAPALTAAGVDMPFPTYQILFHDQTEEADGDRKLQREGWPPSVGSPMSSQRKRAKAPPSENGPQARQWAP